MKLKKLIAVGFKSFADRTEFDFDDGISCIVGPNGCGKSNVVDAIKWVLGEQSAKSLRGSEMMDVIFNGSSSRRPSGCADVTLVFDNADGLLQTQIQSDQAGNGHVSVTRRLFRSGQSEYLINKLPCRLKDVREMFMDTGIGNDAYGVIEQGRVESFLQANPEDRRSIFDEAAGISKYKARKRESLRKLERVTQNLLRLDDILGEVEKRLRSIKYQSGKARNYQAYTERLKEIRSLSFLAGYHKYAGQRTVLQGTLDGLTDSLASVAAKIERLEVAGSGAELETVDLERTSRDLQSRIAGVCGQIATCQERLEMLTARVKELGEQVLASCAHSEQLEAKIATCGEEIATRRQWIARSAEQSAELTRRYEGIRDEHTAGELAGTELQARLQEEKDATIDLLRRIANLHNEIQGLTIRREGLHSKKTRLSARSSEISQTLANTSADRAKTETQLTEIHETLSATRQKLEQTRQSLQDAQASRQQLQASLAEAREKRSALDSRNSTLVEMQSKMEGVVAGVRNVLQAKRDGRLDAIRGMLGEFIDTPWDHAAVVEAALAGTDQQLLAMRFDDVVAATDELRGILADGGSVEVLCLDRLQAARDDFDVRTCPQALGRVIDWVRYEPWLAPVMWRLLGRTLAVKSLSDAVEAAKTAPAGYRFVTPSGEVVEPDGRIRLGAANRAAGVIARRAELAELETTQAALEQRIGELEQLLGRADEDHQHLEEFQQQLRTAIYEANTERVEYQSKLTQLDDVLESLQREQLLLTGDLENLQEQLAASVRSEHDAKNQAAELEQLNTRRQAEIEKIDERIAAGQLRRDELNSQMTELKVAMAQMEQKHLASKDALAGLQQQHEQMNKDMTAHQAQIELGRQRRADAESSIRNTQEEVDRLYAQNRAMEAESTELDETRRGLAERLGDIRRQLGEQRQQEEDLTGRASACRVELGEADVRIEGLISRADDEMGMDLVNLFAGYEHDEQRDWDAVDAEIRQLRQKIERLGNVNLDAITEQDELEKRRDFLKEQLADIQSSREQLNELIRRINRESRERFLETFQSVRANFQELFRKLFGGGRADIMLTDPDNVLESNIEIVARPPGKELRSLSLLSGGEKTMTALAMLFSIFKSRPSPFCLLDEVDAALDETNNERFNRLVGEFVETSQFIIISHAKRTISMANVLYGVTMQTPGVSKRISVRFEDASRHLDPQLQGAEA